MQEGHLMANGMPDPAAFQCRMYENKFPEVDDLIMVNVRQIADMGAYVRLLEYNDIEGMILLSELSRRRIRSIQKLLRVGRNEVVVVLRVDKEKGYIDLSKRRVSPEDIIRAEEKFNKSKTVHSIMRHVAERKNLKLQEFYEQVGWPLYKKYGHAYEAFKLALNEPDKVFAGIEVEASVMKELMANIARRLTPQAIKLRADIEVACHGADGIDAVKESLLVGEGLRTGEIDIRIKVIAPPLYVIHGSTLEKQPGIDLMEKCISQIEASMAKYPGGKVLIKMKPRAVNAVDDAALKALMDRVERENQEVSDDEGDDDDEDGEEKEDGGSSNDEVASDPEE